MELENKKLISSQDNHKDNKTEWKFPDKYKIILLGDNEVGKSCLIHRLMNKSIPSEYDSTIYDKYNFQIQYENKNFSKSKHSDYDKFEFTIEIIDTGDFFKNFDIISNNISNTNCFFFMYGINNSISFETISNIHKKLKDNGVIFDEYNSILIANKIDIEIPEIIFDRTKALKLSSELKMKYFEISVLNNSNIDSILDFIVENELKKNTEIKGDEEKKFCKCF